MRKFNQTISIEVEVDSIASQLLNTISPEFKHREPLVEAIIGTAIKKDESIGHIYNAMNGYLPEINYKIGDVVNCTATTYMYVTEESRLKQDSERAQLGKATVIDINPYSKSPLLVEFDYYRMDGTVKKDTAWVKMKECSEFSSVTVQEDIFG